MTPRPAGEPLTWNVAGLLGDPPGSSRDYEVRDAWLELDEDVALASPVEGAVRLRRTNRGILVDAGLAATLAAECSRCLRPTTVPVEVAFEEEFLPALDMATGQPLPTEAEPEVARLTDHHELDLGPSVRDAILLAEPIAAVCREDCPGLCVSCGKPLDEGVHDHPDEDVDPRLEALRSFRVDGGGETE